MVSLDGEETAGFSDLGACCALCVDWTGSWVDWSGVGSSVGADSDVACVVQDESEETEHWLSCRGDGHCLVLNAFLECFYGLSCWLLSRGCNLGHVLEFDRKQG